MCGGNADPAALGRRVGKELKETMEAGRKCWRATSANGAESLVEVTVGIVNCEGRWATQKITAACLFALEGSVQSSRASSNGNSWLLM